MKKFATLFIVLTFILFSCDKIDSPLEKPIVRAKVVDTADAKYIVHSNAAVSNFRKVLLEDYTGHTCGNCPRAATVADTLQNKYKEKLIVLAVHAGGFALTNSGYPTSYTVTAGEEWDDYFGVPGYPNGMVNRKIYSGITSPVHDDRQWVSTVPVALQDPFELQLNLVTYYEPAVRKLYVDIQSEFKTERPQNVHLITVLAEDGIIGPQLDYRKSPPKNSAYLFNHMLRESLRGTWGDLLKAKPIVAGDKARLFYEHVVPAAFDDKKLSVIVFAYDGVTREVLQAEKVHIQ
jgi:hypothetical protein